MTGQSRRILTVYCRDRVPGALPPAGGASLTALERSSRNHELLYHNAAHGVPGGDLRSRPLDAVVFHGSALAWRSAPASSSRRAALDWTTALDCVRVALPMDEHDRPGVLDEWLTDLGVHVVFTQVEASMQAVLYPRLQGRAQFESWHGVYADEGWLGPTPASRIPASDRAPSLLARRLPRPFWHGEAGQFEQRLLQEAERLCSPEPSALGLTVHSPLVDTPATWARRLRTSRALLGTECGASVLDLRGDLQAAILRRMGECPGLTYAEALEFLPGRGEGPLVTSPGLHLVEAILAGTCLVLVTGRYGGLLEPGLHYLPVRRDLSDLEERLEQLGDAEKVRRLVDRAHADVVESGRVSLRALALQLDAAMDRARPTPVLRPGRVAGKGLVDGGGSSVTLPNAPGPDAGRMAAEALGSAADSLVVLSQGPWSGAASFWLPGLADVARRLPVFVVVADDGDGLLREERDEDGIVVLRLSRAEAGGRGRAVNALLCRENAIRPVVVADALEFHALVATRYSVMTVFVATDEVAGQLEGSQADEARTRLRRILARTDLALCFRERVRQLLSDVGEFEGTVAVVPALLPPRDAHRVESSVRLAVAAPPGRAVFVPGPLDGVPDPLLLHGVIRAMPDWTFHLGWTPPCGDMEASPLVGHARVEFLGDLSPQEWRWLAPRTAVAFLPSSPGAPRAVVHARALHLLASGLPVVSSVDAGIQPGAGGLAVAATPEGIRDCLVAMAEGRDEQSAVAERASRVAQSGWDRMRHPFWASMVAHLEGRGSASPPSLETSHLNVLYLYDDHWTHIETLREYLESFRQHSRHAIVYASGIRTSAPSVDLATFDVVMIHYSVRLSLEDYVSAAYVEALKGFGGFKTLFIQDEYEGTEQARQWIRTLGIHQVYTCVPDRYRDIVYPSERFPRVQFTQILTGYVSPRYEEAHACRPMEERTVHIGYRGRALPYWYGRLGQEKMTIGRRMRQICDARGIPVDIEWDDHHRIYGKAWLDFHENCRAVLGSESGANVFDYHGDLRRDITRALTENPDLTFEEAYDRFLDGREGEVIMAQISPRVFEAISLGAALILFEGGYSGILEPGVHYMSLKKDFSNVDEILERLGDVAYLTAMTARAYRDIVASGQYSYRRFVSDIDGDLEREVRKGAGFRLLQMVVGERERSLRTRVTHAGCRRGPATTVPLSYNLDAYPGALREIR